MRGVEWERPLVYVGRAPGARRGFFRGAADDWDDRNVWPAGLSVSPAFLRGGMAGGSPGGRGAGVRGSECGAVRELRLRRVQNRWMVAVVPYNECLIRGRLVIT